MTQFFVCCSTPSPSPLMVTVEIQIGSYQFTDQIPILCPNDPSDQGSHHVVRNGLDVRLKDPQPQFWCKLCNRFFYAHTNKIIYQFQTEFHALLKQTLFKGRFDAKPFSQNSDLSINQSHCLLLCILHLLCIQKERPSF